MANGYAKYSGLGSGQASGVSSLNSLTGAITLAGGTGISVTPSGNTLTISSSDLAAAIISINGDTTAAQTLSVGSAGTDFAIVDAGSGSHVFNLPTASASNRGALSSADWTTFNSKQSALTLGNLSSPTTGVSVGNGTGAVVGTGTTVSIQTASGSQPGLLSATDWTTFNSKQSAGSYLTSISVATANGLAGSSSGGTTPTITLSTTITGILQGDGTAISAATTTGSDSVVLATSPTLVTPALGTPSALVGTNISGTASSLTAGNINATSNSTLTTLSALSLPYSQVTGTPPLGAVNKVIVQTFASTGTYTPTSGMKYVTIEIVGGGGGGGGVTGTVSQPGSGGGGGGGGYSRKTIAAAVIGSSQTVTIGAGGSAGSAGSTGGTGGTTSVGSIVSATGGYGGSGGIAASSNRGGSGGGGGLGASGDFVSYGGNGGTGINFSVTNNTVISGYGGNSYFAPVTYGVVENNNGQAGGNGLGGGGGGSGGGSNGSNQLGGAGANGYAIFTEYVSS